MVRKLESYIAEKARIAQDDSDLTSRSDLRRDRLKSENQYLELAEKLCRTSDKRLQKLDLGDFLLELICGARRIDSPAARARALRRVRKELRTVDAARIAQKLEDLDHPNPSAARTAEQVWLERLLTSGGDSLETFLSQYPDADRAQLRTLLRNVAKAKELDRERARKKLALAIRHILQLSSAQPESVEGADEELEEDAPDAVD